jgi:hypothetical protein
MRAGNFERAWSICDGVLERRRDQPCHDRPRHLQYIWDGTPLDGRRVLVRCYHGLGDTIQFVRLLEPLHRRARHVTLWAQPSLLSLLQSVKGIDRLLPLHDGVPSADHEVDVELMELPHAMRLTPGRIPVRVPYIYVSPSPPGPEFDVPGGTRRVGIAWRSGEWMPERSIAEAAIERLVEVPGVRWYSLQYGARTLPLGSHDLACRDIAVLAARMRHLDLVISTDTMTAHLAGALGIRVWTLLPSDCDWRWMRDRDDTPWYPTMRLFRQRRPGDWSEVISSLSAALRATPAAPRARGTRSAGCIAS